MKKKEIQKRTKYESRCDNIQLRALENEDNSEVMRFEGYAIVFDQPTILFKDLEGNEYKEIISKSALDNADITDVPLRYNHENSWVLARTRKKTGEGSLLLTKDDFGLKVTGEFVNMQRAKDVFAMMKAQVVDQMSFAFTINDYIYDSETRTTTITSIDKLFDVSVVDTPAYPQTSISAMRSAEAVEAEAKTKELEALEKAEKEAKEIELENLRMAELERLEKRINLECVMRRLNKK